MAIFLGALAMLFAALFFAYAVMRVQAPALAARRRRRRCRGARRPSTRSCCSRRPRPARAAQPRDGGVGARGALALGTVFLVAQVVAVARTRGGAARAGRRALYGSVFFALSGFHALHVAGRPGRAGG